MRFVVAEMGHLVNALPPIDINGGADGDVFSMKDYRHVDLVVQQGVIAAATTLTIEECDDVTPSDSTAIAFNIYKEETGSGDTLGAKTAVTASGVALTTTNNTFYVATVDAEDLTAGYPYLRGRLSDPGASAIASMLAILSDARYAKEQSPTQIT